MAITRCPECGGKVSTRAATCPHCGCPVEESAADNPRELSEPVTPVPPESLPPLDAETRAQAISSLRADPSRTPARTFAGVFGGVLALATFMLTSAADPDGATIVLVSATGIAIALALYWWGRGRRGYPLRWYVTVPLGVAGSVIAFVIFMAMVNPGDPEAMGIAVGAGISYGLLLGTAASFLLYGLRGSMPR